MFITSRNFGDVSLEKKKVYKDFDFDDFMDRRFEHISELVDDLTVEERVVFLQEEIERLEPKELVGLLERKFKEILADVFKTKYGTYFMKYGKSKDKLEKRIVDDFRDIVHSLKGRGYNPALHLLAELYVDLIAPEFEVEIPKEEIERYKINVKKVK